MSSCRATNANSNAPNWAYYGGRGIQICARWLESFENFFADMGGRPSGASIERIDNDGHYEPGNCIWTTKKQQARNRRNSFVVEMRGRQMTLGQLREESGLPYDVLYKRIVYRKWTVERAATSPSVPRRV